MGCQRLRQHSAAPGGWTMKSTNFVRLGIVFCAIDTPPHEFNVSAAIDAMRQIHANAWQASPGNNGAIE